MLPTISAWKFFILGEIEGFFFLKALIKIIILPSIEKLLLWAYRPVRKLFVKCLLVESFMLSRFVKQILLVDTDMFRVRNPATRQDEASDAKR